ncbi:MAG: helix-turn-helix domain-containing protein [Planctomycetes bacterium]|nr:helix-turn-helix domain-containing protein [Planctomycetota bacterium]
MGRRVTGLWHFTALSFSTQESRGVRDLIMRGSLSKGCVVNDASEEFLTAEEAAARLNVTRSYLYRLIKRGVLPEAVGIRNGREVKLIPASALGRLNAHEGLLVRDVVDGEVAPETDREVSLAGEDDRSAAGQSPDRGGGYVRLLEELRAQVEGLREQLARERRAREELEAQLAARATPAPATDVAAVISRANEVTALVKASEIKQNRILEELIAERRWGRARRIAYAAYLVLAAAASIAALIFILELAAQLKALAAH